MTRRPCSGRPCGGWLRSVALLAAALPWTALASGLPDAAEADSAAAPSRRITTTSYMIGAGPTRLLDTYLSAAHFSGTGATFLATRQPGRPGRRWTTLMEHQADFSVSHDRQDKARSLEGGYSFYAGRFRRWQLLGGRLQLQAGAMARVSAGFIYNTSNGNNPAQARLQTALMPSGGAAYRFRLFGRPSAASYEVQLPGVGLTFSPRYGQSYYELFSRGDYDRNIVATTPFSAPDFRQQLMLDILLGRRATLRVGYLGDIRQTHVNQLKSHIYSHRLMIGFVKRFQLIRYRP